VDIYIKPKKKVSLSSRRAILVRDVCDVVAAKDVTAKIKKLHLVSIKNDGEYKKNYIVSVTDIITVITQSYPNSTVSNVGEMDTLVQYAAEKSRDNSVLKWLKIAAVVILLFFGSSTAIMSFHTDGQIPKIFERYYSMFFGEERENPAIVNVPYSIGLALGIIVFYNHFMGKKLTDDPTPIEVEMEKYDNDVTETMVDMINQQKNAENGGA